MRTFIVALIMLFWGCSEPAREVAGGGGVETTNGIKVLGRIHGLSNTEDSVEVFLRPSSYLSGENISTQKTLLNESFKYEFETNITGSYRIEAKQGALRSFTEPFWLSKRDSNFFRNDTLKETVAWRGKLLNPTADAFPVQIRIRGLNESWTLHEEGDFELLHLPDSELSFVFHSENPEYADTELTWSKKDSLLQIVLGREKLTLLDNFDDGDFTIALEVERPGTWVLKTQYLGSVKRETVEGLEVRMDSFYPSWNQSGLKIWWDSEKLNDSLWGVLELVFEYDDDGNPVPHNLSKLEAVKFYSMGQANMNLELVPSFATTPLGEGIHWPIEASAIWSENSIGKNEIQAGTHWLEESQKIEGLRFYANRSSMQLDELYLVSY